MSVQVSYKKQTILGIIGLLIIFLAIELVANVWWMTQMNCEFEENEIFNQMDDAKKRQLCVDLYEVKTLGNELVPNQKSDSININNLGFRGGEFSTDKPTSVYRIFMLGGSTMFGHGATSDETTIPGFVQNYFQEDYNELNIEVINGGIQGADSFDELKLIETKLLNYSPNMVVVYDGWNDLREQNSSTEIYDNWRSMCDLGIQNNFDVIIMLQPIAGFGNKLLTEQEYGYSEKGTDYDNSPLINSKKTYDAYTKQLDLLDNCNSSKNLRSIFDDELDPIYWDQGHASDNGNQIVANIISKHVSKILSTGLNESSSNFSNTNDQYVPSNFESQLKNIASIYKTPLMLNSILTFKLPEIISETPESITSITPKPSIFKTQTKNYGEDQIFIMFEILHENDTKKQIKIKTIREIDESAIPNVTYFLKILHDDKIILNDFFYSESEILRFDIINKNSEIIDIVGARQYDHNAYVGNPETPIILSGPILEKNENYEFVIELRTLYDESNWIFSLDGFSTKIES